MNTNPLIIYANLLKSISIRVVKLLFFNVDFLGKNTLTLPYITNLTEEYNLATLPELYINVCHNITLVQYQHIFYQLHILA